MNRIMKAPEKPVRLVVLISGGGSNLQAVLDACAIGIMPAEVVAVFSNKPEAYGLVRASKAGVPAVSFPKPKGIDRRKYDAMLAGEVEEYRPDWVLLLGWVHVLSSAFLSRFPGKVINLHPALPGTFPGLHAVDRAFEAYRKGEIIQTGVMLHLVPDEGVDCGPILAQQVVLILPEDTLESLEARIHEVEHLLVVTLMKQLFHRTRTP
jgi:phosphoribosylglycinamide formyltransferase-1